MKNKYITPKVEFILLEANQEMMAGDDWTNESGIPGFPGFGDGGNTDGPYGLPNGTVVNNNGAPTFVPGGNGGGGRQTPLG